MTRILVIDDEVNIRMMIRLALEQKKNIVEVAADGPDGLEKFGDGLAWELVLLDQRMPEMEGLDVLREMRRRNAWARVILITAFGSVDLLTHAMQAGATQFLRKPFTIEILRDAVQAALMTPSARPKFDTLSLRPQTLEPSAFTPLTFSSTTVNGFCITFQPSSGLKTGEDTLYTFTVVSPEREERPCTVLLPNYFRELVMARTNRESFPGGERFWQAICEETLANYLWRNAEVPPQGVLRIEELTREIHRWIEIILAGAK